MQRNSVWKSQSMKGECKTFQTNGIQRGLMDYRVDPNIEIAKIALTQPEANPMGGSLLDPAWPKRVLQKESKQWSIAPHNRIPSKSQQEHICQEDRFVKRHNYRALSLRGMQHLENSFRACILLS